MGFRWLSMSFILLFHRKPLFSIILIHFCTSRVFAARISPELGTSKRCRKPFWRDTGSSLVIAMRKELSLT